MNEDEKELQERLNKIKRGPNYEISKNITNEELDDRLKNLKNLPPTLPSDLELITQLNEIHPETIFQVENKNDISIINNQQEDTQLNNNNNNDDNNVISLNENNLQLTQIEDDFDDFESFLSEAGISEKVITRVTKEILNNNLNEQPTQQQPPSDLNITKLEHVLGETNGLTSEFLSQNNEFPNDSPELNQIINQAKDEIRLLPSKNLSFIDSSISLGDLQDVFDDNEQSEIQKIVLEAQDHAKLERKYGTNTIQKQSQPQRKQQQQHHQQQQQQQKNNKKKSTSLTSFGCDDDRSYYYSIQSQDKYNESRHKSKKKNSYNRDDDDDEDDDSDSNYSNDSY